MPDNQQVNKKYRFQCSRCFEFLSTKQKLTYHMNRKNKCDSLTNRPVIPEVIDEDEKKQIDELVLINKKHSKINDWILNNRKKDKINKKFDPVNFIDYIFLKNLIDTYNKCIYCKIEFEYFENKNNLISIERIDNTIGHTKSNCVLACLECNNHRSDNYTFEEFKKMKSGK
jgi:hypothetical protein